MVHVTAAAENAGAAAIRLIATAAVQVNRFWDATGTLAGQLYDHCSTEP